VSPEDVCARLHAARQGRASVAADEDGDRDPADAPPQGGAHPGARAAVLAGAVAGALIEGDVHADVAAGTAGDGPAAPWGVRNALGWFVQRTELTALPALSSRRWGSSPAPLRADRGGASGPQTASPSAKYPPAPTLGCSYTTQSTGSPRFCQYLFALPPSPVWSRCGRPE